MANNLTPYSAPVSMLSRNDYLFLKVNWVSFGYLSELKWVREMGYTDRNDRESGIKKQGWLLLQPIHNISQPVS